MANELIIRNGIITKNDSFFESKLSATTLSATTYLNLPDVEPSKKIVLKKLYLGNRNVNNSSNPFVRSILNKSLNNQTKRIFTSPNQYTGSFLDYYFTVNDGIERKKILFSRGIAPNIITGTTIDDMVDYIVDTYVDINANFYCELWVFLDKDFNEIKQLKLVNPLFNSLHPRKLNSTRSYLGVTEFVRKTQVPDPFFWLDDNTITSNFNAPSDTWYDPLTSEDIPKKIHDIVDTSGFYGTLSGFAQTVINVGSWDADVRNVVNNSVYVETLQNFYTKFIVPTNRYNFTNVNVQKLNNFYGDIFYDNVSGSPLVFSANSNTDIYPSPYFLQLIDTYKIYPSGQFGYIFYSADDEENTALNNLNYSVGHDNELKYINRATRPFGSYIQVIPGINENYSLNVKISGDPDQNLCNSFIDDLFDNRLVLNNPNVKLSSSAWQNIKSFNQGEFYTSVSTGQTEFNFLLQSTDVKMEELSENYKFTGSSTNIFDIFCVGSMSDYEDSGTTITLSGITKINSNGTVNIDFLSGGSGFNSVAYCVTIQPDGKILVGGDFTSFTDSGGTYSINYMCRLNKNGTYDATFSASSTGFDNPVFSIAVQSDGKIICAGNFDSYDGNDRYRILRLNSDGSLDTSFMDIGWGFNSNAQDIKILDSGKILVGGVFDNYSDSGGTYIQGGIVRLNTDGTFDSSFNSGGSGIYGLTTEVFSIKNLPNNQILIGGRFTGYIDNTGTYQMKNILRLNSNGKFDDTFNSGGTGVQGTKSPVFSIDTQSDGKIIMGGNFNTYVDSGGTYSIENIFRLNTDGSFDTSFVYDVSAPDGFDDTVRSVYVTSDDKILCGGKFTIFSGQTGTCSKHLLLRLNSDGTCDTTFNDSGYGFYGVEVFQVKAVEKIQTNSVNVNAIYKGYSFRPFIYPLNLTQIFFDVPSSYLYDGTNLIPSDNSSNNIFEFAGSTITNKKLCLIVYYKKLDSYDLFVEDIVLAEPRGGFGYVETNVITLMINNLEKIFTTNLGNNVKSRQIKPNNLEVYLGILDVDTNKVNTIPNYKIIVDNYGGNLIFRLVKGGLNKN